MIKVVRVVLLLLALTLTACPAPSQTTWQLSGAPVSRNSLQAYCYDAGRDRTVFVDGSITAERQPSGGWLIVSNNYSPTPWVWLGGIAYDRTRGRVVCNDGSDTYHWDGSAWTIRNSAPLWSFFHLVAHERRGTVIAFGGLDVFTSNDLYEWNGTAWTLIPSTNRPPRPFIDQDHFVLYRSAAYDARRDKVVLFGSAVSDSYGHVTNVQPVIWEWDSTSGWTNPTVTGVTLVRSALLFFDSQRGVLTTLIYHAGGRQMAEWDGGATWQTVSPTNPPPLSFGPIGSIAHDTMRGMSFTTYYDLVSFVPYAYVTVSPARFETLDSGCAGSTGEPSLQLTANWTRAWLGRTLSVDLTNLPTSTGFVAIGWSNTTAGPFALPLPLQPYGMPGCFARVATDDLRLITGSNGKATLTMPVPNNGALLGAVLYQQGFSIDPAANAAGLAASGSVRVTIGRL